jgi:hypothetical protein
MKVRLGFVSNSSSSSFTCDVCGGTESGMDCCLSDCEMFICENKHTCCNSHMINNEVDRPEDDYDVEEKYCPLCNFKSISQYDLIRYFKSITNKNEEEICAEIRENCKSYAEFQAKYTIKGEK